MCPAKLRKLLTTKHTLQTYGWLLMGAGGVNHCQTVVYTIVRRNTVGWWRRVNTALRLA